MQFLQGGFDLLVFEDKFLISPFGCTRSYQVVNTVWCLAEDLPVRRDEDGRLAKARDENLVNLIVRSFPFKFEMRVQGWRECLDYSFESSCRDRNVDGLRREVGKETCEQNGGVVGSPKWRNQSGSRGQLRVLFFKPL